MKLNNKRGVSDVITTVLMILLVIAAIGILWLVVSRFVRTGTEGVGSASDCLSTDLEIVSANNVNGNSLSASVKRNSGDGSISEIKFFVGGSVVTVTPTTWPSVGETKTYENATAINSGIGSINGKSLEVAAVIGTKTCQSSDPVTIASS